MSNRVRLEAILRSTWYLTRSALAPADASRGRPALDVALNHADHRKLARARTADRTSQEVGRQRGQRRSSRLRRSLAAANGRASRAMRLLAGVD